ncbi:MAG: hypothetical protein ACLGGX_12725 [Bdellovibrionia bacterium]
MKKLVLATLFIFVSACGQNNADKIAEAQTCLDKARTTAQAEVCFSKVDGVDTSAADGIRCSAKFVAEGFATSSRLVSVFDALDSGGVDALMSLLTFTAKGSIAADTDNATNTFEYCYNSGSKGSTLLMAFSNITMSMYYYIATNAGNAGVCPTNPIPSGSINVYPFESCFSNIAVAGPAIAQLGNAGTVDPAAIQVQTAVGTTIIATHLLSCATGSQASQDLCSYFENAINAAGGTSNPRAVAIQFFTALP